MVTEVSAPPCRMRRWRRAGGVGLALWRLQPAVEGDIALDILGLSGAREFERCGSAKAIAHHHGGGGVSSVARLVQAREQELPHPRAVLVELRRLSLSGLGI